MFLNRYLFVKILNTEFPGIDNKLIFKNFTGEITEKVLLKYVDILNLGVLFGTQKFRIQLMKIVDENPEFVEKYLSLQSAINPVELIVLLAATNSPALAKNEFQNPRESIMINTGATFSQSLISCIKIFPEDVVEELFKFCKKYLPNQLNYIVLKEALYSKSFDEEFLIKYSNLFKSQGLAAELKKYANTHDYYELEKIL